MMHYAIAGYGTVLNFADRLGDTDAASKLKICLENTRSGDKHMTAIAERRVNEQAMAG
jgi:ferritin-like metal-binding protein YciE